MSLLFDPFAVEEWDGLDFDSLTSPGDSRVSLDAPETDEGQAIRSALAAPLAADAADGDHAEVSSIGAALNEEDDDPPPDDDDPPSDDDDDDPPPDDDDDDPPPDDDDDDDDPPSDDDDDDDPLDDDPPDDDTPMSIGEAGEALREWLAGRGPYPFGSEGSDDNSGTSVDPAGAGNSLETSLGQPGSAGNSLGTSLDQSSSADNSLGISLDQSNSDFWWI